MCGDHNPVITRTDNITMTIKAYPTLYKTTSLGQTQYWYQEVDGRYYRTCTGKIGGKLVQSAWTECKPKNVGRSNETSANDQAILEVEANYRKKLAQGNYKETMDTEVLAKDNFIKPMLAKKYGEDYEPTELDYAQGVVYSQPKLDGIRCLVTRKGMFSRKGKPIVSAPHILEALQPVFTVHPEYVFDGELYADNLVNDAPEDIIIPEGQVCVEGHMANFNKIISLARQTKPTAQDLAESKATLQYHIYDLVSEVSQPFAERHSRLQKALQGLENHKSIVVVSTVRVAKEAALDDLYGQYQTDGYEGQMVRISGKGYEGKRSKQLLKRKEFLDDEFEIVDILEGIGNRSGIAGSILCRDKVGKTFGAGIKGTWGFAKELLENRDNLVGTLVTVRYQNLTPDEQVPRFGIAVGLYQTNKREL